jgi:hypothetical protein
MPDEHILRNHYREVIYSEKHKKLLYKKRKQAQELLRIFKKENLTGYVYGSIARGDIHKDSDIDIIFLYSIPPYKIEFILNQNDIDKYHREIITATPSDAVKLYIHIGELISITVPLTKLSKSNLEFYNFGGKISYDRLQEDIRVPGIDKRLVLIKPTEKGHEEFSILNQEHITAKTVGVSLDIIEERKRVLLRREKYGRTGVFLKKELSRKESVGGALKKIADKNSIIRKKIF